MRYQQEIFWRGGGLCGAPWTTVHWGSDGRADHAVQQRRRNLTARVKASGEHFERSWSECSDMLQAEKNIVLIVFHYVLTQFWLL